VATLDEALRDVSVVMLATDHKEFIEALTPSELVRRGIKLVVDGKNALDGEGIAKANIHYYGIGRQYIPEA